MDVDIDKVAELTEDYSGADLEVLVKESVLELLTNEGMTAEKLTMMNVEAVLGRTVPSLPKHQLSEYSLSYPGKTH